MENGTKKGREEIYSIIENGKLKRWGNVHFQLSIFNFQLKDPYQSVQVSPLNYFYYEKNLANFQTIPCAIIAFATFINPATLAPFT